MKIQQVILEDFRQFYGRESVDFSTDEKTNVTLVHAENGVGKTTLLNAVLWCFYGIVTAKFERPEEIVNFSARDEGRDSATVTVIFEHEGQQYQVARAARQGAGRRTKSTLTASRIAPTFTDIPASEDFINTVIPQGMAKHFFFDGEAAEVFSSESNRSEVSKAIRTMLGCDIADTALADLKAVVKSFEKDEARALGDRRGNQIQTELEKIDEETEGAAKSIANFEKTIETADNRIDEIDGTLRLSEVSKQFSKERKDKEDELRTVSSQQRQWAARRAQWVQEHATGIVARKLTKESLGFLEEGEFRGKIPSPYNEEFVQELLEGELCICGRELEKGSDHWGKVTSMLKDAASATLRSRVTAARGRISDLERRRDDGTERLREIETQVSTLNKSYSQLERDIEELSKKLQSFNEKEVADLEKEREVLKKQRQTAADNKARFVGQQAARDRDREKLRRELDQAAEKNERANAIKKNALLAAQCEAILSNETEHYQKDARDRIRNLTRSFLDETLRGHFTFNLDDDFAIYLTYPDGRVVPKSTGQNQLISLAFIVSLVRFSKERVDDTNQLLTPGVVAPLVLDSPFGQLDPEYRRGIAKFLPEMGDQVVLLVSGSQGDPDVRATLDPIVGREYILSAEFKEPKGDKKAASTITLHGRDHSVVHYDCERDRTLIQEVERA